MYRLEFLPKALQDIQEIRQHFEAELGNPAAARRLAAALKKREMQIARFPYASPVHISSEELKYDYRRILVRDYLMFYLVDEERKIVTVTHVIHAKRDVDQLLLQG